MDHITVRIGSKLKPKATVALVLLVITLLFLIAEHNPHLSQWRSFVPYLLVLACPLMHLFMHGGHDDDGADRTPRTTKGHDHGSH